MVAVIIMAGGSGSRFWPVSREDKPKQCLRVLSDKTMIEETVGRLEGLAERKDFYVSTGKRLYSAIKGMMPEANYVVEPCAKNTAAAMGLATITIYDKNPEATIFVETADHVYKDVESYLQTIRQGVQAAEADKIVLIGIKPTHPHTGLGYIKKGERRCGSVCSVEGFREKPDLQTAEEYLSTGDYLWNSGMFIFKAKVMMEAIKKHLPLMYKGLMEIKESGFDESIVEQIFGRIEDISIDYGIMEKEDELLVVETDIHWDDIGDWAAIDRLKEKDKDGNVIMGEYEGSARNCLVYTDAEPVSAKGVQDLLIVNTSDSLLIAKKEHSQLVKEVTSQIKRFDEMYLKTKIYNPRFKHISIQSANCDVSGKGIIAVIGVDNLKIEKNERVIITPLHDQ